MTRFKGDPSVVFNVKKKAQVGGTDTNKVKTLKKISGLTLSPKSPCNCY